MIHFTSFIPFIIFVVTGLWFGNQHGVFAAIVGLFVGSTFGLMGTIVGWLTGFILGTAVQAWLDYKKTGGRS